MLCSMLHASMLQTFLSRYVSDMLYRNTPDRVIPSLIGASVILMVPGGVAYAFLLSKAPEIPWIDRALDWLMFMELIPVWLQMAYITATKDYRRILMVFAAGMAAALSLGAVLLAAGFNPQTALIAALAIGYGVMLVGNTGALLRYFNAGSGSALAFECSLVGHDRKTAFAFPGPEPPEGASRRSSYGKCSAGHPAPRNLGCGCRDHQPRNRNTRRACDGHARSVRLVSASIFQPVISRNFSICLTGGHRFFGSSITKHLFDQPAELLIGMGF